MDKAHRDEKDQMQAEKTGDNKPKKKVLNFAEVIAKKQAEEEENKNKQVRDPKGIKLQGLSQDVVEKELYQIFTQYCGQIERIWLPYDGNRIKGFAIINFVTEEAADKALAMKEVSVGFTSVDIKEAFQS